MRSDIVLVLFCCFFVHAGCRIFEELPVLIESDNFCVLFVFFLKFLNDHWDNMEITDCLQALSMLSAISSRVSSSLRAEYHLEKSFSVVKRLLSQLQSSQRADIYQHAMGIIFRFLKGLIPLHPAHAALVFKAGLLTEAIDFIIQQVPLLEEETDDVLLPESSSSNVSLQVAIQFLMSALNCGNVVNCNQTPAVLFPQLKLSHLKRMLSVRNGLYFKEAVCLFTATFGNFLTCQDTLNGESDSFEFLDTFLDRAIKLNQSYLHEVNTMGFGENGVPNGEEVKKLPARGLGQKSIWESIRIVAQDSFLFRVLLGEHLFAKRMVLLKCIEEFLQISKNEDFDLTNGIMCVDAMAILGGWIDKCWMDSLGTDKHINDMLAASAEKFLRKNNIYDGDMDALSDDVVRDSTYSEMSNDEILMKIRSSFSILDIQTTPLCESSTHINSHSGMIHGVVAPDDVINFISDWEVESTASVCYKIMKLVGISRCDPSGLASLESLDLVALAEILIELLTDDRHGLCEVAGMQEKCIQLLTDIMQLKETVCSLVCEHTDFFLEMLADWTNFSDTFLIHSCVNALIVMGSIDSGTRRRIIENFDKFQAILLHIHQPIFLLAVLELCWVIMPSFKKLNYNQEVILFNWMLKCMSFRTRSMIVRVSQLIYKLSDVNHHLISKTCSRSEVETYFIDIVKSYDDKEVILLAMRTLTVLTKNFNKDPCWVFNWWLSLPIHISCDSCQQRVILSPNFISDLLQLQCKFEEPCNMIVLAYSLDILSTIRCLPWKLFGSKGNAISYAHKFYSFYMPLVAGLLAMITRHHVFCEVPENIDDGLHTTDDTSDEASDVPTHTEVINLYDELMSMPLEEINPLYELLGASVVNALHSLVTYESTEGFVSFETYNSYAELFCTTPICESIIYIMIQLPNNYFAQVKGIIALEALLRHGIGARILSECCTRVLTSAIISFVDDSVVLHAFCSIVNTLSVRDAKTRTSMVAAGVHKWLYVVIKGDSPVLGPMSCHAIFNLIQDSEENSNMVGESGIVRPTLSMLEKHPDNLKVQFEGLQLITALCKSKSVFRKIKECGGEGAITSARKMLDDVFTKLNGGRSRVSFIRTSIAARPNSSDSSRAVMSSGSKNQSSSCDNIDDEDLEYTADEIKNLVESSTPMKLSQQKCAIM